jgi:hypothetical protein
MYLNYRPNDHGYVPLVVNTSRSFSHSRLITGFVARLTRRVPLVEQELLALFPIIYTKKLFHHLSLLTTSIQFTFIQHEAEYKTRAGV